MKRRIIALLAAASMAASSMPVVSFATDTVPEPVLRYTFDGTKELADENGKNELKLEGGASVTDEGNVGKGLLLDGVDGYAILPENILTNSMTISTWVKINRFATWGRVFDFGTDSTNNFFLSPYSGGTTRIEMKTPSDVNSIDAPQETEREWVHYAVTYDNGTINYYRNGRLEYTKSNLSIKPSDIKNELNYIGKSHYDADAYLSAAIDDFRVYDRALTIDEINEIFAEGEISGEILLKSYSIEDGQLVTGDKIDLPQTDRLYWNEIDNLGLIDTETGKVKHNDQTEKVTLIASYGDYQQEYTVYVTGAKESPYMINIDAADRSKDVSDEMWGLFFEDINSAADGGLYAEMVQNRSFETEKDGHLYSWTANGDVKVNTENPLNDNNPTYVTLGAGASITNDGFLGMSTEEYETYDFSMYVRLSNSAYPQVELTDESGKISAELSYGIPVEKEDGKWQKISGMIVAMSDADNAKLTVTNNGDTPVDLDMISLIPEDTYKGHGLRKDFMEALEAMHPKFLRFPGGCAVEGRTMDEAWNWKDTVGDVAERKEMINIWDTGSGEYKMTYGLGFYEYFQMCEDLDMEPVPILNCGMACQARSGGAVDETHLVPMDELQPYIDDALDLIEFANGTDESNEWVKLRIDMGHPEPFDMKYIGIGNEQFGEIYFERYYEFAKQIHEKYPDINLVSTSGTASSGTNNDLAWNWINANTELADRVDEHYYESADWFRTHAYRYDNYRRDTNSKVFLGEYASKGNAWYNALSEAAFMTGLERNADVVRMASYAPMFAKYGNTQWSAANMIWFTNDDYVLTPNYYVQSLFSNNQGDYSLPTDVTMNGIETDDTFHGGIVLGSWGTQNEFKDIEFTGQHNELGSYAETVILETENGEDLSELGWETGVGDWSVKDGVISQTSDSTGATCFKDINMSKCYLELKARKLGGGEGFQIGVAAADNLNYYRVNIGGWGNTTAKIQHIVNGVSAEVGNVAEQSYVGDVHIEDNKWYDVRVEVTDYEIKAYLDGEFICSYTKPLSYGPIYASSVYDDETGEVIVKVVNTLDSDVPVDLNITGTNISDSLGKTFVMEGDTSLENTLENKTAIAPYASEITNASNNFTYNAPANSLTVMRLSADDVVRHKAYISGYTDGTFRPDNTITRTEAISIIARQFEDFDNSKSYENTFNDVSPSAWYANAVNFAREKNIIEGYEDNNFAPEKYVTRAEFATMLTNQKSEYGSGEEFTDISNHWAEGYIKYLSQAGDIYGYEDGTFRPDNTITRAEVVAIMNRALGRNDKPADLENPFSDVSPNHWAYGEILEAAVSH